MGTKLYPVPFALKTSGITLVIEGERKGDYNVITTVEQSYHLEMVKYSTKSNATVHKPL